MNAPLSQPSGPPTTRQVALGLFILWQLVFLVGYNGFDLLRDCRPRLNEDARDVAAKLVPDVAAGKEHLWDTAESGFTILKRWKQATGQDQEWALFAPSIYKENWFPVLLITWGEDASPPAAEPVWPIKGKTEPFLSDNEPVDPRHYCRFGHFRLRRYECNLLPGLYERPDEDADARKKRWTDRLERHFREYGDVDFAYVRWRYAEYKRRHPEKPPASAVFLVERRYDIRPHDDELRGWVGPSETPIARWRPGEQGDGRRLPLERYNFVTGKFESVSK